MKFVAILFVAVLALANAQFGPRDEYEKYHNECQNDPATRIGQGAGPNSFAAHTMCIAVKMGMLKPNGDVNPEGLRKFIERLPGVDAVEVEKIIADCSKRHGGTPVQAAMDMMGCVTRWAAPSPQGYHQ